MIRNKTFAVAASILLSGCLLAACGGGDEFSGTWTGQAGTTGEATLNVDGKKCDWQLTEADNTGNGRCERDDEEFKLADPKTGQDLKYIGKVQGNTLTLAPDNKLAENIGALTLTRLGEK
ncbi:hypothetical protein [Corynebacterium mayonis]|uniref:hypothetical protein n=1 Tax=Corynebacterium mayonis TaxID=3062461 RepID=UPI00314008B3